MAWEYKREERDYQQLPVGDFRIRIASATKEVSKAGNEMLSFKFDVSGSNLKLFHHITFLKDRKELTNQKLTEFFDSFKSIKEGDFDTSHWVGAVGACRVKHDEDDKAKISYFIKADRQDKLPAWKEPENATKGSQMPDIPEGEFMNVPESIKDDLPF